MRVGMRAAPFGISQMIAFWPDRYRVWLFDLDGTLVDSNQAHVDSWDRAFRHFGKEFSREKLEANVGKGSDKYLPSFLTDDEIKEFGEELDQYRSDLFRKEYLPEIKPFPGVRELFHFLTESGRKIMLVTSGKEAETKHYLKLLQIETLVSGYTTADDAERSKPAPDIFEQAREKAGASRVETLVIGDTRFDFEAAARAHLDGIGFHCGGKSEKELCLAGARNVFRDPNDLLTFLKSRR